MRENWEGQEGEREKKREEVRSSQREKREMESALDHWVIPQMPVTGGTGPGFGNSIQVSPTLRWQEPNSLSCCCYSAGCYLIGHWSQ